MASPKLDQKRLNKLIRLLGIKPRSVPELLCGLRISRRTLYRDFERLESIGLNVRTVGFRRPTKYYLDGLN
jgi:predicted DNA-binding transcriptional regulator YafY